MMNAVLDLMILTRVALEGEGRSSFPFRETLPNSPLCLVCTMAVPSKTIRVVGLLLGILLLLPPPLRSQEPDPVVHVVFFYSPACAHCHEVINTFLLPLQDEYGSRLVILGFDTSQQWANDLLWAALRHYEVPEDKWAVPFMIVDETVLVGGFEIPSQLRTILDEGLERGGIDLPSLPALLTFMDERGLLDHRYPERRIALQDSQDAPDQPEPDPEVAEELPTQDTSAVPSEGPPEVDSVVEAPAEVPELEEGTPEEEVPAPVVTPEEEVRAPVVLPDPPPDSTSSEAPESGGETEAIPPPSGSGPVGPLGLAEAARDLESMTMMDRFQQDPTGNSVAVVVLLGMLVSLLLRGFPPGVTAQPWPRWVVPVLVVVGMAVASYLSFIEITHTEAVCGPVGDCNTVNQSSYATLFGFLPVGVLGLMGYALILLLWGVGLWGPEGAKDPAQIGLWGAALFGILFSVYLTFLEPFVIGATCAWCLSSAVIMTLLLWATSPLAAQAWPGSAE